MSILKPESVAGSDDASGDRFGKMTGQHQRWGIGGAFDQSGSAYPRHIWIVAKAARPVGSGKLQRVLDGVAGENRILSLRAQP